MDAGNAYRHRYDNVAESFVWATLQDQLTALLDAVLYEIENLTS